MTEWIPIPSDSDYEINERGMVRRNGRVLAFRVDRHGYIAVSINRGARQVHRLLMAAFVGPAQGRVVRHLDGNSLNNDLGNLAYGTPAENTQDSVRHGTHANAAKTHCRNGHEYTDENTYISRKGGRHCRTCNRAAVARYKNKRTAA